MIYIAHRGNLYGSDPKTENTVDQVQRALNLGFEVEVDVWYKCGLWYLGHDEPKEAVSDCWLLKKGLWLHCKNLEALDAMLMTYVVPKEANPNYFWHENDQFTLTSHRVIWTYPGGPPSSNSVLVLNDETNYSDDILLETLGICADNIADIKERLEKEYGESE